MADELGFDLEAPDLRRFLDHLKEFNPALARELRKELRASGDAIIAEQRAILSGPKPGSVKKVGTRPVLIRPKNGRSPYIAQRNIYESGVSSNRSRGMRNEIKAGLKTRISTSATKQGINIRTTKAGAPMSIPWQSAIFHHPVFSSPRQKATWAYQKGQPYFWSPVLRGYVQVRARVADAIDRALQKISD
jgi:hypothetical protein